MSPPLRTAFPAPSNALVLMACEKCYRDRISRLFFRIETIHSKAMRKATALSTDGTSSSQITFRLCRAFATLHLEEMMKGWRE